MATSEDRFIDLDGALNFRDLGGLPITDGARTRRGVMFRSDALHHLEPAGVDRLVGMGIRTIVDLRSSVEIERSGRGRLGSTSIGWLHAPLSQGHGGGDVLPTVLVDGDLGRYYVESLPGRTEILAQVITSLGEEGNLPAVFHCTAGKDRTGMVAALILSLVGVPDDVIVHDYTLTDDRMVLVMERIRSSRALPDEVTPMLARVGRAEATSMEVFLAAFRDQHGNARGWARAAGISEATLASFAPFSSRTAARDSTS